MSIRITLNIHMIYTDTPVCEWNVSQISAADTASAAIFHIPYQIDDGFYIRVQQAIDNYDNIIILCSELHDNTVKFIRQNQHPKIQYFTCGIISDISTVRWMDWFINTTGIYKHNNLLDQLEPYQTKPKYFDALLGWSKPHRQIIYNHLKNNDHVILTYLQDRSKSLTESGWILADGCDIDDNLRNTITQVTYHDKKVSVSQIIPFSVYNQTAYSIVAETNYNNDYSFYTEKIVKPILAERLFVVFSGQHYLKNLRSLGFKTFDGIIDESYDNTVDPILRFNQALETIDYLLKQPQDAILKQIQHVTQHNKQIMLDTDWQGEFLKNFSRSINSVK